jgi:methylmalonyl-CoA/ethylmalonyl-CoA epimerase
MIKKIDHVGIVVRNIEEALELYVNTLGFEASEILIAEEGERFRSVMVSRGEVTFELIEPMDEQGGIQNFLKTKGEGIHHVSLEVDDIREELGILGVKGVRFLMKDPRQVMGTLVTFIHPKSTKGVLMEVLQRLQVDGETDVTSNGSERARD